MRRLSLILVLALCGSAAADDAVKLPAEVKASPGRLVRIKAETAAKAVDWDIVSPADLGGAADQVADLIPFPGTTEALFSTPKAGRYVVTCWAGPGQKARCVVVVVDPVPPTPPVPPAPPDPLRLKIKAAYDLDAMDFAGKEATRKDLVALYRQAAGVAADPAIATAGALLARVKAAAQTLAPDQLLGVRTAAGVELAALFPDPDAALTPESRASAAALFVRLSTALNW